MTACPKYGSDVTWKFYRLSVSIHSYSTDDIARLKNEIKEEKVKSKTVTPSKWEECGKIFSSENSLRAHRSREHHDSSAVAHPMKCQLCLVVVKEWSVKEEESHVLRWVTNTPRTFGERRITYLRCSRALKNPMYKKAKTKKVEAYCTAFMKEPSYITVTYCHTHCGHEETAALLNIDKTSEAFIVSLLQHGFSVNQTLKKLRSCDENTKRRAYYTTATDVRRIAIRHRIEPGRKHENDLESLLIRAEEEDVNDGIRLYIAPESTTGDGFALVIITPIQKTWLERYSSRGIFIDDTFNLIQYTLKACLLSYRMTEKEVGQLFDEVKKLVPSFGTDFFMSDDTNSF